MLSFYLLYCLNMLSEVIWVHHFAQVTLFGFIISCQHSRHITQHALKNVRKKIFILVILIDNILTVLHYTMPSSRTQSHVCFHSAGKSHREFYRVNVVDICLWICVWLVTQTMCNYVLQ